MATSAQLLAVFRELEKRIAEVELQTGGPQGPRGPIGPKGRKGEKGINGPIGPLGNAGKDGTKGPVGSQGPTGAAGHSGPMGGSGSSGRDGISGSHGRDGTDGVSVTNAYLDFDGNFTVTLSDGTEIDAGRIEGTDGNGDTIIYQGAGGGGGSGIKIAGNLPDGSAPPPSDTTPLWYNCESPNAAMYYAYFDGDSYQWVPVGNGQRGPAGANGSNGVEGPQGPPGTATIIKGSVPDWTVPNIPVGPTSGDAWILDGTTGAPNRSYDNSPAEVGDGMIWDGTVWFNGGPLRGPQGLPGAQGPVGANGQAGAQGAQGDQGIQGIQGIQGDKGDQGDVGANGGVGPDGPIGITGPAGPQGGSSAFYYVTQDPTIGAWDFLGGVGNKLTLYNSNSIFPPDQMNFRVEPNHTVNTTHRWVNANNTTALVWTVDASTPNGGEGYMRWTAVADSSIAIVRIGQGGFRPELLAGQEYTWKAWVFNETGTNMSLNIGFYDAANGTFQGQTSGANTNIGVGVWALLQMTFTPPVGGTFCNCDVRGRNVLTGQGFRVGPCAMTLGNTTSDSVVYPALADATIINDSTLSIVPVGTDQDVGDNEVGSFLSTNTMTWEQNGFFLASLDPNQWPGTEIWEDAQGSQWERFGTVSHNPAATLGLGDIWVNNSNTDVSLWDSLSWRKIGTNA
jgi:hypothetical protein